MTGIIAPIKQEPQTQRALGSRSLVTYQCRNKLDPIILRESTPNQFRSTYLFQPGKICTSFSLVSDSHLQQLSWNVIVKNDDTKMSM